MASPPVELQIAAGQRPPSLIRAAVRVLQQISWD